MNLSQEDLNGIKKIEKTMQIEESKTQRGSRQWTCNIQFDSRALDGMSFSATIELMFYARQNERDAENFSCGIFMMHDGKKVTLSRYNGAHHENDVAKYECHIHHATATSINRGDRKPEHADTQVTDRYSDLNQAVQCLAKDYNITLPDTHPLLDWMLP